MELGDVLENEQDVKILQFDGEAPQMSENGMPPQMNGEKPELPEDGKLPELNGEMPQFPADGQMPQFDGEAPQMSENGMPPQMNGEMPELPENGELPSFNGEVPQMPQMNDVLQSQKAYTFIANGKMVEVNLESIGVTLDDLTIESVVKVGDVIGVSFGSNNSIESIKFYTISE